MPKFDPYAAPPPGLYDSDGPSRAVHIAGLPVSDVWKTRFTLIEKAGGAKLPGLKDLTSSQRFIVSFNFLAFVFWPVYYFTKGMLNKGAVMVGVAVLSVLILSVLLSGLGLGRFAILFVVAAGAVFGMRANIDYYRKMVLGEDS